MGRKKRIWISQCYYHIVSRGNRRDPLFIDIHDFEAFFHILRQVHEKTPFSLASYCLMTNHYHLQLRSSNQPVSKVMSLINKRYATYYNTRYRLSGHVFEKRFYDKAIETKEGMLEVSRYIHLNPVRANMIKVPEQYAWSSFRFYISSFEKEQPYMDWEVLLDYYSGDLREKQQKYYEFVRQEME
ncbi:transposase [Effusibacillus consociatus]|uniref:Transposase n=1 Tax=Effusibacillus consociatus TaxID=1117041 RepID=A0ABV9Q6L2_9BACL